MMVPIHRRNRRPLCRTPAKISARMSIYSRMTELRRSIVLITKIPLLHLFFFLWARVLRSASLCSSKLIYPILTTTVRCTCPS